MRVEIRNNGVPVAIITFHTNPEKFDSDYERIKFFKELHGWNQTVPKNGKKYEYRRPGLLDEIPHVKIADSAFMIAMENMDRVMSYFQEWSDKVECEMMEAMIKDRGKIEQLFHEQ
ncbi:MAG: hypothetical protein NT120_01075 [Candidatus Aenigmarchaeota archaeon]|nr:hypothetical protein [Candidatus Aenigmarchaeota archaeon]